MTRRPHGPAPWGVYHRLLRRSEGALPALIPRTHARSTIILPSSDARRPPLTPRYGGSASGQPRSGVGGWQGRQRVGQLGGRAHGARGGRAGRSCLTALAFRSRSGSVDACGWGGSYRELTRAHAARMLVVSQYSISLSRTTSHSACYSLSSLVSRVSVTWHERVVDQAGAATFDLVSYLLSE